MTTRNTAPEPENRTAVTTDRPGRLKCAGNTVAWYTPELTVAAASAGAAATVWAPLGVISAACGAWITTNQITLARERRRVRREVEQQRAQRQLDHADDTDHQDGDGAGIDTPDTDAIDSSHGEGVA